MAYTASTFLLGKGTTVTVGSDTVTNAKIVSMPEMAGASIDIVHLGGTDVDVGAVDSFGEISIEIPHRAAFTSALVIGTSYNITVTDSSSATPISSKAAKLVRVGMGQVSPTDGMTKVYTFKFTVFPYAQS